MTITKGKTGITNRGGGIKPTKLIGSFETRELSNSAIIINEEYLQAWTGEFVEMVFINVR